MISCELLNFKEKILRRFDMDELDESKQSSGSWARTALIGAGSEAWKSQEIRSLVQKGAGPSSAMPPGEHSRAAWHPRKGNYVRQSFEPASEHLF